MSESKLEMIYCDSSVIVYKPDFEWLKTHSVRCIKCNTIVMPQRMNAHCNCGRVYCEKGGIVVFNIEKLDPVWV